MNANLIELLRLEIKEIKSAVKILEVSYNACKQIGIKKEYGENELLQFEGLTARFSRLSDIIIQKVLRTIMNIELERYDSTRDLLNLSEKNNIIHDAHKLAETRIVRNRIVHEYILENFENIFEDVLLLTTNLIEDANLIISHCEKNYKI